MNHFTTDLVQALVTNKILQKYFASLLDYEIYDRAGVNSGNSHNGS